MAERSRYFHPLDVEPIFISLSQDNGFRVTQGDRYIDRLGKDECLWTVVCALTVTATPYQGLATAEEYKEREKALTQRRCESTHSTQEHPRAQKLFDLAWDIGMGDPEQVERRYAEILELLPGQLPHEERFI